MSNYRGMDQDGDPDPSDADAPVFPRTKESPQRAGQEVLRTSHTRYPGTGVAQTHRRSVRRTRMCEYRPRLRLNLAILC